MNNNKILYSIHISMGMNIGVDIHIRIPAFVRVRQVLKVLIEQLRIYNLFVLSLICIQVHSNDFNGFVFINTKSTHNHYSNNMQFKANKSKLQRQHICQSPYTLSATI